MFLRAEMWQEEGWQLETCGAQIVLVARVPHGGRRYEIY